LDISNCKIAVIGLGYVGLPLAMAFAKQYSVLGFDINESRITELEAGQDSTRELTPSDLSAAKNITYSADPERLQDCNVFIVTVPTPVDSSKRPDITALRAASALVGNQLSHGGVVIYESTVYPGATEQVCVPILAQHSGLVFNQDFHVGYSPERINPGDKTHRVNSIIKVTSVSTPAAAEFVDTLYGTIIDAGTHKASSIKVAEAAKVIENTHRDMNIALINELAIIFHRLGLDTEEVLQAAGIKWNFLPFRPALLGGHCISVDPYYLTHKAQEIGYHPEVILAGRKINDGMGPYVSERLIKEMIRKNLQVNGTRVLVMGLTSKENCPDIRNTRVVDIIDALQEYQAQVDVYDPWVDAPAAKGEYRLELIDAPETGYYDAIVLAVGHTGFLETGISEIRTYAKPDHVIFDVKYLFPIDTKLCRL